MSLEHVMFFLEYSITRPKNYWSVLLKKLLRFYFGKFSITQPKITTGLFFKKITAQNLYVVPSQISSLKPPNTKPLRQETELWMQLVHV